MNEYTYIVRVQAGNKREADDWMHRLLRDGVGWELDGIQTAPRAADGSDRR